MIDFVEIILNFCCKRILIWQKNISGFFENLFEYYILNIVVNVNFFSDLNITVSTTLKYYHKQALNKKLKLMEGAMKYFPEKLLGHQIIWSPGLQNFFSKICKTIRPLS